MNLWQSLNKGRLTKVTLLLALCLAPSLLYYQQNGSQLVQAAINNKWQLSAVEKVEPTSAWENVLLKLRAARTESQQGLTIFPGQVSPNCPVSTRPCAPCFAGEQYCRVEEGKDRGFKGWACQNNNPGNIRYSDYRNQLIQGQGGLGACGQRNTYMVFRDYSTGRNALKSYIRAINAGKHTAYPECGNCSLRYFFSKYAPAGDQNDPNSYSANVARKIGVNVDTTTLSWVVSNKLDGFVDAIQAQEGWFER
jgi:hypothetical protein